MCLRRFTEWLANQMESFEWRSISCVKIYFTVRTTPCPTHPQQLLLQLQSLRPGQKQGPGTRIAPSYVSLFMGYLEMIFLILMLIKPSFWLRFINEIFLLWPHGADPTTTFLEQLNSHYNTPSLMPISWKVNSAPLPCQTHQPYWLKQACYIFIVGYIYHMSGFFIYIINIILY